MKTLVVYSSQSGNTRKLAEALYDSLEGEKTLRPVADAPPAADYDLVALGFWLQGGKPDSAATAYIRRMGGTDLFLFATHGAAANSPHVQDAMAHARDQATGARVRGSFSCQGAVAPMVLEKAAQKDPPPVWLKDAASAGGHPNAEDVRNLRKAFWETCGRLYRNH
jgi:flavodoxin I